MANTIPKTLQNLAKEKDLTITKIGFKAFSLDRGNETIVYIEHYGGVNNWRVECFKPAQEKYHINITRACNWLRKILQDETV